MKEENEKKQKQGSENKRTNSCYEMNNKYSIL